MEIVACGKDPKGGDGRHKAAHPGNRRWVRSALASSFYPLFQPKPRPLNPTPYVLMPASAARDKWMRRVTNLPGPNPNPKPKPKPRARMTTSHTGAGCGASVFCFYRCCCLCFCRAATRWRRFFLPPARCGRRARPMERGRRWWRRNRPMYVLSSRHAAVPPPPQFLQELNQDRILSKTEPPQKKLTGVRKEQYGGIPSMVVL